MVLTQSEFDEILSNKTKKITENITWVGDKRNSETVKFRVPVASDREYPIFVDGSYNRYLERLSYKIIHREIGRRIYGLDMGKNHRNPDGEMVGDNHIHKWSEEYEDRKAYSAQECISARANQPLKVWQEFCQEANIDFQGVMEEIPPVQLEVDFDLGGIII